MPTRGRRDVRREDGTFVPLGAETPAERTRRLTGARADAMLAAPAALAAFVKSCRARLGAWALPGGAATDSADRSGESRLTAPGTVGAVARGPA